MTAKTIFFAFLCSLPVMFLGQVNGQNSSNVSGPAYLAMPKVFKLGENGQQYENLMPRYQSLLEACGGDMRLAHGKLHDMMEEMEVFADSLGYDLNGIKAWMHFFWKEDGSIEHIGFYLKPNSRNVDTARLGAFLKKFSQHYQLPVTADAKYSHYSTFSFPVF